MEPVIHTQSPEMPQQRPRFFRGRSSVVAVTPGVTTPISGQDGLDTTCCLMRGRVPQGTSGPGLSPRGPRPATPNPGPYQAVGDGLPPWIQVHVVVVVARAGVHGHAGGDGEQEAPAVP